MISGKGPSPRWAVGSTIPWTSGPGFYKRGERKTRCSSQKTKGTKGQIIKMSGLYREKPLGERQPSHWTGEFSVVDSLCKPYPVTDRN